MNYTYCLDNNLEIIIPSCTYIIVSSILNIVLGNYTFKFLINKKKQKLRLKQLKEARYRRKTKYSNENLEYRIYVKRINSSIPEWAYNDFVDNSI